MADDTDQDTLDYHEIKAALPTLGFIDTLDSMAATWPPLMYINFGKGTPPPSPPHRNTSIGTAIEYDVVLTQLVADPNLTADQVAVASAQSTIIQGGERTWSAIAVDSRLDTLLTAVDQFGAALYNGLAANRKKYDRAFGATRTMWQAPMDKDLYDMAFEIDRLVSDANIKSKAQSVMNAFNSWCCGKVIPIHIRMYMALRYTTFPKRLKKMRITPIPLNS